MIGINRVYEQHNSVISFLYKEYEDIAQLIHFSRELVRIYNKFINKLGYKGFYLIMFFFEYFRIKKLFNTGLLNGLDVEISLEISYYSLT